MATSESLFLTTDCKCEWEGFSLILPSVGISNVGQMAVDMVLFNLKEEIERVSDIYDEAVLPVVSQDLNGNMCQSLEVYHSKNLKLVILQQRAPFVKGRIPAFRSRLLNWVKACKFGKVVMLSGVSSHVRTDTDLNTGSPFRFLCTAEDDVKPTYVSTHGWIEYSVKKTFEHKESLELAGSGMVKSLYEDCQAEKIPFLAMLVFCNQGDATAEINCLVGELHKFSPEIQTSKTSGKWRHPPSWQIQQSRSRPLMMF